MALSAGTVWEIRPNTGAANNSGGFNPAGASPGTDYSQQNAAQVAFDGVTVLAVTGGVSPTITITGHTVSAADNRNLLAITGGTNFIAGIYEITNFNAGANTWTLDRNCTTGVGAAMTGNMGGARSGFSNGTTALQGVMVAGNLAHVANQAWNEAVAITVGGGTGTPLIIQGYNSARADIQLGDGNANNPVNDRATAAGVGITCSATIVFKNINVTRAGSNGFGCSASVAVQYVNCRSYNNGTDGWARSAGTWTPILVGCEGDTNTSDGVDNSSGGRLSAKYSNFHDNGAVGIVYGSTSLGEITGNLFYGNTSHGIQYGANQTTICFGNTFNANTGSGILVTTPITGSELINNIFSNNGAFGAQATDGDGVLCDYNNYYNNSSGARSNMPTGANDIAVDPQYTNAGSDDYSINATLPGFPGTFPAGLTTGFLSIGAVQPQAGTGGASTANYY